MPPVDRAGAHRVAVAADGVPAAHVLVEDAQPVVVQAELGTKFQAVATVAAVIVLGLPGLAVAIALYVLLSIIKREK